MPMRELVKMVLEVKDAVQEWDLVLMNQAKSFLIDHLRVVNPRLPDGIADEGPIQLTKRYVTALRRFAKKHKDADAPKPETKQKPARPKKSRKRPLFDLASSGESDSSSEDEADKVAAKLKRLAERCCRHRRRKQLGRGWSERSKG